MNRLANRVLKFVVCAAVCGFAANAVAGWTYDSGSGTISDGSWTLNVSGSADALSVNSVATAPANPSSLDLGAETDGCVITAIGSKAFENKGIVTLGLPETLTTIGSFAFSDCKSLTTVTPFLPASVTSIGQGAFNGATRLSSPLVLSNPELKNLPSDSQWSMFRATSIPSVDMSGSGITSIGYNLFNNCSKLTSVKLPAALETIGASAFNDCKALKTVTPFLPETLTSIGAQAFQGCPVTNDLVLANAALTSLPGGTEWSMFRAGQFVRADLSQSGITSIGSYVFYAADKLTSIIFPETLTSIDAQAFAGCSSLKDVQFLALDRPTLANNAFSSTASGGGARFRYPARSSAWSTHAASFVAWDVVDAGIKSAYEATYPDGPTPIGTETFSSCVKCLVPVAGEAGEQVDLSVFGEPALVGEANPDYGDYTDVGPTIAGTVSQYGDDGQVWYESVGYRIDILGDSGWEPGTPVPDVRSASYTPAVGGAYRLAWLWNAIGYAVIADVSETVGSVTVSTPSDYGANFYRANATVTVLAIPVENGAFLRWEGDVPEGRETDNPLTLTIDGVKRVSPLISVNWTLEGNTISDGLWKLSVSGSREALTVTGVSVRPSGSAAGLLDLAKPIVGGGAIVGIGNRAFSNSPGLVEVRLPETLVTIGDQAFIDTTSLTTVTPFLPASVTSIGVGAFYNCRIANALVLSNPGLTAIPSDSNRPWGMFVGNPIPSVDLSGSRVAWIGDGVFSTIGAMTELRLPDTLERIGASAFADCKALKTVVPFLPASVTNIGNSAFVNVPVTNDLVLSNRRLVSLPANNEWAIFRGVASVRADLSRSGVKTLGMYMFCGASNLMSIDLGPLPTFGDNCFGWQKGLPSRITYPAGDAEWARFIATSTESGALKLWKSADVTQAERDAYLAGFPATPKPVGKMSIGGSMKWLVPRTSGMMILLQ